MATSNSFFFSPQNMSTFVCVCVCVCVFFPKTAFVQFALDYLLFFRQCAKIRPQKTRCNFNLGFFLFFKSITATLLWHYQ
jgi:hypothetical protein